MDGFVVALAVYFVLSATCDLAADFILVAVATAPTMARRADATLEGLGMLARVCVEAMTVFPPKHKPESLEGTISI